MADIRELMILDPGPARPETESGALRKLANFRMAVRRAVVRSSRNLLARKLYVGAYNTHLRVVTTLGKRYRGTRAVYLCSGLTSGDFNIGVSDIDIAMYGDWTDARQFRLMKIFGVLTLLFPLFDQRSLASISSVEDLQELCRTDMFMALNHAVGARQWKLLHGENVLAELPEVNRDRFAGCVAMDVRRWWNTLARTAFGVDITGRDRIFRNSICFKSAAGMLKAEQMLDGGFLRKTRKELLQQELVQDEDPVLPLLLRNAEERFLDAASDPCASTVRWFLPRAERFHERLHQKPYLTALCPVRREGTSKERVIAPETMAVAERLAENARTRWSHFRAAYLAPAFVLPSMDSLALVLEVDGDAPSSELLHELCQQRMQAPELPQRLVLFLLLRHAMYQLDIAGTLDFFHHTLTPGTAPDLFLSLADPAFTLAGEPRRYPDAPRWTPMAQEIFQEELTARRGAYARFGVASRKSSMENVRNLWRLLQLTTAERSLVGGEARLPVTMAAVQRAVLEQAPDLEDDLQRLEQLHAACLRGEAIEEEPLLSRIYGRLSHA